MILLNRGSGNEGLPAAPAQQSLSTHGTLPPPVWTTPKIDDRSSATMTSKPLPRRTGARAEEAWLRARVEEGRAAGDGGATRQACTALARWLASRDRDLDEAVELGASALQLGSDVELRRELSAWLESLGEAARAAAVLKPIASLPEVESTEAAYVLMRVGVLKARAGAAAAASSAFEAALAIDDVDPLPCELLGTLSAWHPESAPAAGVDAYIESARRRGALKQDDAELVDLWRAFTADPSSDSAARALSVALERRGRAAAADDVLRAHAHALASTDPVGAARVHAHRRASAVRAREPARALGAALDEGLAAQLDGRDSEAFDALLLDLGMLEALAARLELRIEGTREPSERAAQFVQLARLFAGPLADEGRAALAYVAALAADPTCDDAQAALRTRLGEQALSDGTPAASAAAHRLPAMLASVVAVVDERERYAQLVGKLRSVLPAAPSRADPTRSDGRFSGGDSAASAWVHESVGGGARGQASSLELLAASESPPVRAILLAVAAERYLAVGNATAARHGAELAVGADPSNARCVAALADAAVVQHRDRRAVSALERAIGVIGPRATWCFALADTFDALGETELAAGWSQRCVALRPGDRDAIKLLLSRLLRAGDGSRLRDALAWLLSQPQPASWAADLFADALSELGRLDADRAAVVARRALDVFGPKSSALRDAMLGVAEGASDHAFTVSILERWLSAGAEGSHRREVLLRLADLRLRLGDEEGEARTLARAVREGFGGPEVDQRIERPTDADGGTRRQATPDALVWRMRTSAARLAQGGDAASAVWAWRDLGGALWDLADDRIGAIEAWQRAARVARGGQATLALDLVAFAGAAFAFKYLARLVEMEPDDATSAVIGAEAAGAALSVGEARFAFDLAARGLARSPACAEALDAAERAAHPASEQVALSALYDLVAARSFGRFGRRATHYRGARFFERSGDHTLSLKHAAQAFHAVPSEGATFQSLARAAQRAGDRPFAMRTVEQVAEGEQRPAARAMWLLRAASLAGDGEEGTRRKVDVLLRAVVASPKVTTITELRTVARELLRLGPEDRDGLELRLGHAARAIGGRLEGPEGARVALAFAQTLLELVGDSDAAFAAVERAFACDADVEEFDGLMVHASALGRASEVSSRIAAMLDAADRPHNNVGICVLRLLVAIAVVVRDDGLRARACVAAALRAPEDDTLVIQADDAVRALGSRSGASPAGLADGLADRVAPARRAAALIATARSRVAAGAHSEAAAFFERATDLLEEGSRAAVERELRVALDAAGRTGEVEARAQREAVTGTGSLPVRADGWTEVAELREGRGDHVGAVKALLEASRLDPEPLMRWSALERVAEIAGDDEARVAALEQIERRVGDDGRPTVLKRLARAHEQRGDLETAERTWRRVLALDPEDEQADQAIQAVIVTRGDYDALVDHLAQRAGRLHGSHDKREMLRAVRLRRAAILEQRLGRAKDACDELELLLGEWPESVGALRYLADLLDRQSDFARSAPLWRRAAALEENPTDSGELELRAARASRAAGDLAATHAHASRVLAVRPSSHEALALRIDGARATGAHADLGDALDALATRESVGAEERSNLLLESAQAAARAGDLSQALDRARRAVSAARGRAAPQLVARTLEYRMRGAGAPDEARQTIEELCSLGEPLGADDAALRAFLLAEALDVVQGGGAGFRELEATLSVVGNHPIVALGLAERLAAQGHDVPAVDAYRSALAGPLLELRRTGAVALSGADAAMRIGSTPDAVHFLDVAEQHEDARAGATARRIRLAAAPLSADPSDDVRLYELEAAVHKAPDPAARARARFALARGRLDFGDVRGAEPLLWEALADGLTEAGDVLAPLLASSSSRTRELVRVRWQQVALEPGDIERLESLRAAALVDDDRVHARAVEHVLRAFDPGAGPVPPPALAAQPDRPGILALLARPSMDSSGEALALLWEGASQLFVRDAASYGISGIERVLPGPSSPIARLYDVAIRVLDVPRIPLFVARSTAAASVESHGALLSPPSVILAGDVRQETATLRFELGRGIAAALPHNVLRSALPKAEGRAVVEALRTAFGPPERGRQVYARVASLAESFWQMIPPRTQRRLQEVLRTATPADYAELVEAALQSGRRVGMFLAGDFACAARSLLAEAASGMREPPSRANLRALCSGVPALADLLRLAVRPEYADARWHSAASASQRRTASSGRFNLF
jgi:tetratricopeptide (TPR) repeat protein